MHYGIQKIIILASLCVLVLGCIKQAPPTEQSVDQQNQGTEPCALGTEPVCGADGVTYADPCKATVSDVQIAHAGACTSVTALEDRERLQLFWLLKKRMEYVLPSAPIRHAKTIERTCDDCYVVFYSWDNDSVIARIEVDGGEIVSAADTTGFNYLTGIASGPRSFSDY